MSDLLYEWMKGIASTGKCPYSILEITRIRTNGTNTEATCNKETFSGFPCCIRDCPMLKLLTKRVANKTYILEED